MMERARSMHAFFFKGPSLVIPTTNEFPAYEPLE